MEKIKEEEYISILDREIDNNILDNNQSYAQQLKTIYQNWKVNKKLFNFFLQKRQFS